MSRVIDSTTLGIHNEALAMLGGRDTARRLPNVFRHLVEVHIPEARAVRRAEDQRRRDRERSRWTAIASGERPALLLSEYDRWQKAERQQEQKAA